MRYIGGVVLGAVALFLSGCATAAAPGPTVTVTATASPEVRGPETRIDALDAYALCAARIYSPPMDGSYSTTFTPFADATIERTDSLGWYVLFKRTDTSPVAADYPGLGTESWGRCALDGTILDVTWIAGGYCSGSKPVDDLSALSAIEPFDASNPQPPVCPTGN